MPNIDSSDYIRRRKLSTIKNANDAANQTKFRVLTTFDSYDPSLVNTTAIVCNDRCRITSKPNSTFEANKYIASRVPYFN